MSASCDSSCWYATLPLSLSLCHANAYLTVLSSMQPQYNNVAKQTNKKGEELIHDLCERLKDVLLNESSVHHIAAPVTVVGDVRAHARALVVVTRNKTKQKKKHTGAWPVF